MSKFAPRLARNVSALLAVMATWVLAIGCGGGPAKSQVSGKVTLDGVPIENGTIEFYPVNGGGQTAGAGIEKGLYKATAGVGEMTVVISASKVVGKNKLFDTPDSPVVDKLVSIVPDKYNKTSELKTTLKAGVNENVDFALKSK